MKWLNEYKLSLKNIHAEEWLDVYFFRPQAYIIIKAFYSLPITPNGYSLLALISGLISAYFYSLGTTQGYQLGSIFFLGFCVLDCCDGMLARLKKNGTEFGRLIDGLVDYAVNASVYIGLAYGMYESGSQEFLAPWVLVILSGVSKVLHSGTYDHYLTEYLSYEKGDGGFIVKEIDELKNKIKKLEESKASKTRIIGLKMYLFYSGIQAGNQAHKLVYNSKDYLANNLKTIRLWSFIGPSAHSLFLIFALLLNMPNLFFAYAIIFGNVWLMGMYFYQFKINNELSKKHLSRSSV